jgi:hypothetical protein
MEYGLSHAVFSKTYMFLRTAPRVHRTIEGETFPYRGSKMGSIRSFRELDAAEKSKLDAEAFNGTTGGENEDGRSQPRSGSLAAGAFRR